MQPDFAQLRRDYTSPPLHRSQMLPDPLAEFQLWFDQASQIPDFEANAMTLATADERGRPSARVVLLKGLDHGFIFYSHYSSRKGQELAQQSWAALVFFWPQLQRQIRIEGEVEIITAQESDTYFASRPRGAQLGAWASPQSQEVSSRQEFEDKLSQLSQRFPEQVERPPHWGGYRLVPQRMEFWQGRPDRNHDRIEYLRQGQGWSQRRLGP